MKRGQRPRYILWSSVILGCMVLLFSRAWRQSCLNQTLISAIQKGEVTKVRMVLQQGADPNAHRLYENKPRDMMGVIKWIFRSKSIVWHDSPMLHEACQSPQPVLLAKMLLEQGADPNGKDSNGYTALLDCIEQDNAELVNLLLEYGANVNAQTPQGDTALILLAGNQFATVRSLPILIAYGAVQNLQNNDGKTALQLAYESKHFPAIRLLEKARK